MMNYEYLLFQGCQSGEKNRININNNELKMASF